MLRRDFFIVVFVGAIMLLLRLTGSVRQSAASEANRRAAAQLAVTLPEVKLYSPDLDDAIDFLRDVAGANIHVDWQALKQASVTKDTFVNIAFRGAKAGDALQALLDNAAGAKHKLTFAVVQGVVIVSTTRELRWVTLFGTQHVRPPAVRALGS